MKLTLKKLEGNVNVSKTHPLAELLWLVGGLILVAAGLFAALGLGTDWAAARTPIRIETWLGHQALAHFPAEENPALQARLMGLLDALPADSPLHQYQFRVFLSASEEVNAVALPGGNIVVFAGLLQQVASENELAMVLAHELGHFAHRDHLRGLGRGLGLSVATALLLGQDSFASRLVSNTLLTFQLRYSQAQESAADRYALGLLARRFGHAGGATDFFARMAQEAGSRLPYLLASHPHPQARIEGLQKQIASQGYVVGKVLPVGEDLRSASLVEN